MRTTLVIEYDLAISAKKLAAERGCSLSALVGDALRALLDKDERPAVGGPFRLPVFDGGAGGKVDTLPADFRKLAENDELNAFRQ